MTVELTLLSEVTFQGRKVTSARLRDLLAMLAGDLRRGCSTGRLVEGLWPDKQPDHPANALQVVVSRARSQLGSEVIVSTTAGYRLALGENEVDSSAVLLSATAGAQFSRAGDHAAALAHAEAGLALWDGPPGAFRGDPLSMLRAERALTYKSLVRVRALSLSRLGRAADAVEVLTDLFGERPRDEELLLELLRCEEATLGPAAAMTRYEEYRRSLRDELGSDPGPALQAMHQQLLQGQKPVVRHGVRHEPNTLLGRDDDIVAVSALLRSFRVTSIVGPGGLGKTRLAHTVSRQAEQRIVHFVPLAGVSSDDEVVSTVASALESRTNTLGSIAASLGPGPVLLVLDNCEHVVRGAAELVQGLVAMTRDVRVLTTSRAPLGLSSESVYLLPELDLSTSVELFTQRARAARTDVVLPREELEDLCRRLDGLPLAVELAAARVRVMSVAEISSRLADRFTLLRGGVRDAPERHHTLLAVVDWSWNLLDPDGQAALLALSVFPGGFTSAAALRLLGDDSVLEDLVDQSLVKVADTKSGTRLRMLETVREFCALRRKDDVTERFLAWARHFGLGHYEQLFGPEPVPAVEEIRAEQDNLVHALRLGLSDGDTVASVGAALAVLWTAESNYLRMATLTEMIAWPLSHYRPSPEYLEATRTVLTLCTTNMFVIKGVRAARSFVALRKLPPAPPDTVIRVTARLFEYLVTDHGALHAMCDSRDPLQAGIANGIANYLWVLENEPHRALAAASRMLELLSGRQHPWLRSVAHTRVADLCMQVGQPVEARGHMQAALVVQEELGAWSDVAQNRWSLVLANLQLGAVDEAEHWLALTELDQADEIARELLPDLGARAEISLARGEIETGLRRWRRAVDQLGNRPSQIFDVDTPGFEPWTLEYQAVAVIAHAQHGRLDLVKDIIPELPGKLSALLGKPASRSSPYIVDLPICGALLIALAMVDLPLGSVNAVRMIALAERFRFLRAFQPTMSPARARAAAEDADKVAYDDAVSSYAALGRDELRAAALELLRARPAD